MKMASRLEQRRLVSLAVEVEPIERWGVAIGQIQLEAVRDQGATGIALTELKPEGQPRTGFQVEVRLLGALIKCRSDRDKYHALTCGDLENAVDIVLGSHFPILREKVIAYSGDHVVRSWQNHRFQQPLDPSIEQPRSLRRTA